MGAERLSALCARLGLCSRSEATRYIRLGLVEVDGKIVQHSGALVPNTAAVSLLDRGKRMQASKVTIMLNKPLHYVTCRAPEGKPLARRLLTPDCRAQWSRGQQDPRKLGRLDAADILDEGVTGLLLFSQDGRVTTRVSRDPLLEKEYVVHILGHTTESQLVALREGLNADGAVAVCDLIPSEGDVQQLRVKIQGCISSTRVRQMCSVAGLQYEVITRARMGDVSLGQLQEGQWTVISSEDILSRAIENQRVGPDVNNTPDICATDMPKNTMSHTSS